MSLAAALHIRNATLVDIPAITFILNYYITHTVSTFRLDPLPILASASPLIDIYTTTTQTHHLPFLVCVADEGVVVGYAYLTRHLWPTHACYRHTADLSIYVHHEHRGRGIGTKLMDALMDASRSRSGSLAQTRIQEVLSVMSLDVEGPGGGYALRDWYTRWGFVQVGHMKRVGYKFGRWIDVLILQASIKGDDESEKSG
ncbi:hypothetical protein AMATHDRAFT_197325 [Amanita thiersii Skay4041]|uniref:N-acetyltransferase domain-containing protein n=1 Tax=Amanita thiersii Skay4041 TaxID=703135 RepID=A0A2A9NEZ8_9AGAR|nr:hypothetical protein AMATHDRAFT_197325 [Amanita thiersii Skay4041]